MRVKSIVLDGFKSYAHRQELADLDKHFNAITGFNGSGKSNVFDAICFVMGISNLKKVRAEDTRDLIFRGGAAGVQSARVTIEFINDDPKTAPAGYPPSEFPIITVGRQTQVGGKQRYFFLNRQSDAVKIKHFFQNINLNVDNPHFMVLQGTVHKLIGMKSSDILALVEEAVGTKVFDLRRRSAETLIRSKEKRLQEINHNLTHEIGPMLEAMKADQDEYGRFLQLQESLETKRQFRVAFNFWSASQHMAKAAAEKQRSEQDLQSMKQSLAGIPALLQQQEAAARELELKVKEPEGAYTKLHEEEADAKKEMGRIEVRLGAMEKSLNEFLKQQKVYQAEMADHEKSKQLLAKQTQQRNAMKDELATRQEAVESIKKSIGMTRSGIGAGDGGKSIEEERNDLEQGIIRVDGELRRSSERAEELQQSIETLKETIKSNLVKAQSSQALVEQSKRRLTVAIEKYKPFEDTERRAKQVAAELSEAQRNLDTVTAELQAAEQQQQGPPIAFHYARIPSVPDMASRIRGRLGQLIAPRDKKFSLALSVGAQQHLFKVVVDTDLTAQVLVEQGHLRQRTSFLPINQVRPPRIDPRKIEEAQRAAMATNGFATVASELVSCADASVSEVVKAIFGGFLVCSDLTLARKIAFDPRIGLKAVTLDGQTADPQGLMSGGSVSDSMDIIARIQAVSQRMQPLTELQARIRTLEEEQSRLATEMGRSGALKVEVEEAEDALRRVEAQLRSVTGSFGDKLAALEKEHERITTEVIPNLKNSAATLQKRLEEVQQQGSLDKTALLDQLERRLKDETKQSEKLKKLLEEGSHTFDKLEADVEQRDADLQARGEELQRETTNQHASRDAQLAAKQDITAQLESIKQRRAACDANRRGLERELQEIEASRQALKDRQDGLERKLKEADQQVKGLTRALDEHKRAVSDFERRHNWLRDEQAQFGDANGPYYFLDEARTKQTIQEIDESEALAEKLSKRVNKKSTVLYEGIKKEFDELIEKRATLDEDRAAILEVIERVEARKWDSLDRMVLTVSDTFSMLFSACLPGAACRLVEERNDHGHICGLQVRVAFNGKEKESLTELSGGQRSLLALCLILAILRLKPAPIYILDEVDAALDPSHTQNIGRMLQQHFSNSQFLLVSLKDGMFSHANVLFEVRNTQGFSEITRKAAKK